MACRFFASHFGNPTWPGDQPDNRTTPILIDPPLRVSRPTHRILLSGPHPPMALPRPCPGPYYPLLSGRKQTTMSLIVVTSLEPIVERSGRPFSKVAFKAALAAQPGKITCPRSGNDKPCRLDLAALDDF